MNEDKCVCCGNIVPEGRQVCWLCEHNVMEDKYDTGIFERAKDEVSTEG